MSKKTRANFVVAEKLRKENTMLGRQIDWLISQIRYASDNPRKEWAQCGFCPSTCGDIGCEFTWCGGMTERPDCERCWREYARRGSE